MQLYFSGRIERVIFENPANFYRVVLLEIYDTNADYDDLEIIVAGNLSDIQEDDEYTFWGQLIQHPRYGQQLTIERYEKAKPSKEGLIKYFSSGHFKGIGQKTAQKILDLYGEDPIDKILENPQALESIKGFSKVRRQEFLQTLEENYGNERILSLLVQKGIPNRLAFQIQDFYQEKTLEILNENPYQLVEDIQGIGFQLADRLAGNLGIAADSPQRLRAGLVHSLLDHAIQTGNTYMEARELLEVSLRLLEESRQLEVQPEALAQELSLLLEEGRVQNEDSKIFDNSLYYAENGVAKHLQSLMEKGQQPDYSPEEINQALEQVQEDLGVSYDNIQKQAVKKALESKVFFLTGGPGTGKTTVIKGIIAAFAQLHDLDLDQKDLPILLAAPTGRAARRMADLTGLPAATIHRHLAMTSDDEEAHLSDYLDADLIIVDEFSMVDTWLANQLLANISIHTQVIIVGDADQLPSVGPGQVLADLLTVPGLPQIRLEKIYRQGEDSTIISLASKIRKGSLPLDFTLKKADRSYHETRPNQIPASIEKIASAALRSGIDPYDIQVLAPMYRGSAGIDAINQVMQNLLNPLDKDQPSFDSPQGNFRHGDKVIHLINDAESNVFNGDIGIITDLIPAKYTESKQDELVLAFDENEVSYPRNDWYKIRLAYAMSIHKSQGSEFPVVILPLTLSSRRMLERNLLYTAITRAKDKLVMLGEIQAFQEATQKKGSSRKTYLRQRFDPSYLEEEKASLDMDLAEDTSSYSVDDNDYLLTEENWASIDPMIGLDQDQIASFFQ